jgi:hypothetical protein
MIENFEPPVIQENLNQAAVRLARLGFCDRIPIPPYPVYLDKQAITLDMATLAVLRCERFVAVANLTEIFGASALSVSLKGLSKDAMQTGKDRRGEHAVCP